MVAGPRAAGRALEAEGVGAGVDDHLLAGVGAGEALELARRGGLTVDGQRLARLRRGAANDAGDARRARERYSCLALRARALDLADAPDAAPGTGRRAWAIPRAVGAAVHGVGAAVRGPGAPARSRALSPVNCVRTERRAHAERNRHACGEAHREPCQRTSHTTHDSRESRRVPSARADEGRSRHPDIWREE